MARAIVIHLADGTMKEAVMLPKKYSEWVDAVRKGQEDSKTLNEFDLFSGVAQIAIPPDTRAAITDIAVAVATDLLDRKATSATPDCNENLTEAGSTPLTEQQPKVEATLV